MAESLGERGSKTDMSNIRNDNFANVECAVCLQTSVHPAELPCGHIFCYLCIKGIVNQGRRCAMCRQEIPVEYLDKPRLLKPVEVENVSKGFEDGHLWFYEGHNGWWQYDERTSQELEAAYQKGERCCELLIAGFLYIADFDTMLQYRRSEPGRRRRIKRDLATISSKGVAGLKAIKNNSAATVSTPVDFISNVLIADFSNLHIPERPVLSQSHNTNSQQNFGFQTNNLRSNERISSVVLENSGCNFVQSNDSNTQLVPENISTLSPTNLELDTVVNDTLDWTIEQIEALNSELTIEYENLFSDINNSRQ